MSELDGILDEVRALVASGRPPDEQAVAARIRASAPDDDIAAAALQRLHRVLAVHRSRAALAKQPARPRAPAPTPRRPSYRARPTITGNMEVRRESPTALAWTAAPGVAAWEVRLSERADARSDYAVRETVEPAGTRIELELGELPLRVHILGRDRGGRLVQRAVISGLTRETWDERWQRRASAS
ncbi:MAG: hypothetical protein ACYDCH_06000 [Gaiellaceae bacterium]